MKKLFKIQCLTLLFAGLSSLAAMAADSPADAKRLTADQRQARIAACMADPEKCRAERQARYAQWCDVHPVRCKEMQARMEQRMAECKANPEQCRTQRHARREQWCKEHPAQCREIQARMQQRMAECNADPEKCRAERQARFEQRFKLADKDGNGMISRAEAEQAMPRMLRRFDRIDADHDGQATKEEIAAARKAHFEGRRRRTERPNI